MVSPRAGAARRADMRLKKLLVALYGGKITFLRVGEFTRSEKLLRARKLFPGV